MSASPGISEIFPEAVVSVQCRAGYYLQEPYTGQGQITLRCKEGGSYDKVVPVCARKLHCTVMYESMNPFHSCRAL